jgi:hypothetical protein
LSQSSSIMSRKSSIGPATRKPIQPATATTICRSAQSRSSGGCCRVQMRKLSLQPCVHRGPALATRPRSLLPRGSWLLCQTGAGTSSCGEWTAWRHPDRTARRARHLHSGWFVTREHAPAGHPNAGLARVRRHEAAPTCPSRRNAAPSLSGR